MLQQFVWLSLVLSASCADVKTIGLVKSAVASLSAHKGKSCSLSELGELLRVRGVELPAGSSLSKFVLANSEVFELSGPPSNRKVGLASADASAEALVSRVRSVLLEHSGPMTTSELRLRLRAAGGFVPGLSSLLRANDEIFAIDSGAVSLVDAATDAGAAAAGAATPVRLQSLALPVSIDPTAMRLAAVREVILLDLDNRALLALEAAARHAMAADDVLVLAFCSTLHNPRLPRPTADDMAELAERGRLRQLTPTRDCANAADFLLSFWVGWLHAHLGADARFVLRSEDAALQQTLGDLLKSQDREVHLNPRYLE